MKKRNNPTVEQYYYDVVWSDKSPVSPVFEELTSDQVKDLEKSTGWALYKIGVSIEELKHQIAIRATSSIDKNKGKLAGWLGYRLYKLKRLFILIVVISIATSCKHTDDPKPAGDIIVTFENQSNGSTYNNPVLIMCNNKISVIDTTSLGGYISADTSYYSGFKGDGTIKIKVKSGSRITYYARFVDDSNNEGIGSVIVRQGFKSVSYSSENGEIYQSFVVSE